MFLYLYAKEHGWRKVFRIWWNTFKEVSVFRCVMFLVFYTTMILFRTLLNRSMWANPLSNVIGVWGLYDKEGKLTTEVIENLILFIPFTVLLMWAYQDKLLNSMNLKRILLSSMKVVFLFSLTIEFTQLFLRIGTFQLSDLFYNTLGGIVGGFIGVDAT